MTASMTERLTLPERAAIAALKERQEAEERHAVERRRLVTNAKLQLRNLLERLLSVTAADDELEVVDTGEGAVRAVAKVDGLTFTAYLKREDAGDTCLQRWTLFLGVPCTLCNEKAEYREVESLAHLGDLLAEVNEVPGMCANCRFPEREDDDE